MIGGRNLVAQWPCATKSLFISLRITPFRTGIYGIAWVIMGVNTPHMLCCDAVDKVSLMVNGARKRYEAGASLSSA